MIQGHYLKQIFMPLFVTFVFIVSTAGSCDNGNGSTGSLPRLTDVYTEKWDIPLDPVYLRYDLSSFVEKCNKSGYSIEADLAELSYYHAVAFYPDFLNFYHLLINADNYSGCKPEVRFSLSQEDCRGSYTRYFQTFNDTLCNRNTIPNMLKITSPHEVDFSAHTIKTSQNNIFIKWNQRSLVTGFGVYMNIDKEGTIDYPPYLITTGIKGGNRVGIRIRNHQLIIVENTISDEIVPGEYEATIVDEEPIISDALSNDVCVAGELESNVRWEAPIVAELN